jgi:hypothetical protein
MKKIKVIMLIHFFYQPELTIPNGYFVSGPFSSVKSFIKRSQSDCTFEQPQSASE